MRGWIYLIESLGSGLVKMGFSFNVERRMKDLQTGSAYPLRFIGAFPGDQRTEKHIHKKYDEYWESGEWYKLPFGLAERIIEEGWEVYQLRECQMELAFDRPAAIIEIPAELMPVSCLATHVLMVHAGENLGFSVNVERKAIA